MEGWSVANVFLRGNKPTYPRGLEEFLQQPVIVECALKVWLQQYGFDEQKAAMVSPWLYWWFRDPGERLPEEEARFVEQMCRIARIS
jgi:hypothetical protein